MERIVGSVEWVRFERLLSGVYADSKGRPSYPPIVLFKCLLLQQWYRLSDPGLEEAVADPRVKPEDLSFRRFVGQALHDDVPDHSTISRFRTRLGRLGLVESLFDELERQLAAAGLILKQGTLIDATVVQADATPYSHERAAERSDKDAGFTLTRRGYRLGYKAHVAMDAGSRLIRRAILMPANRHESHWPLVRHLVQGDEAVVYADTAYDTREIRADLVGRGIGDGILKRGHSRRPLTPDEKAANARLARRRVPIESLFGLIKRAYGYGRVRYRNLRRNATQLLLLCMAINLRRMLVLTA